MNCLKSLQVQVKSVDDRMKTSEGIEAKVDNTYLEMKKLWNYIEDHMKRTDDRL